MKLSRNLSMMAVLAGFSAMAVGCSAKVVGSGKLASEPRAVSGFHGVELAATGHLEITPDTEEKLIVEAEDNILPLIETRVKPDGTLVLAFKSGEAVETHKTITFKLSCKALDKLVLSGSGDIHLGGRLMADNVSVRLPGSGNIALDELQIGALTAQIEGSGNVKVAGTATSQDVQVPGSGRYQAATFRTYTAKVSVEGSGDCKVWAEKKLEVDVSGSGTVAYRGHPELKQRVTGSGEVHALTEKEN